MQEPIDVLKARLNTETAKIGWAEIQRFFAKGQVFIVAPDARDPFERCGFFDNTLALQALRQFVKAFTRRKVEYHGFAFGPGGFVGVGVQPCPDPGGQPQARHDDQQYQPF